uniref:Uncharacterized protein n=1 Tax=Rhizophora mucronata TaxID=61149 RepID=A0A2P2LB88_RHIMU
MLKYVHMFIQKVGKVKPKEKSNLDLRS